MDKSVLALLALSVISNAHADSIEFRLDAARMIESVDGFKKIVEHFKDYGFIEVKDQNLINPGIHLLYDEVEEWVYFQQFVDLDTTNEVMVGKLREGNWIYAGFSSFDLCGCDSPTNAKKQRFDEAMTILSALLESLEQEPDDYNQSG